VDLVQVRPSRNNTPLITAIATQKLPAYFIDVAVVSVVLDGIKVILRVTREVREPAGETDGRQDDRFGMAANSDNGVRSIVIGDFVYPLTKSC